MTLIIAKIINQNIYFVSDTKITDNLAVRNNVLTSNLKIFILNPKICIAFAGNVHYAEKFLDHFYSLKNYSLYYILQYCTVLNKESGNTIEFGVGFIDIGDKMRLYKIKDGKTENDLQNFWLGDKKAFEKYQKHFLNKNESEDNIMKMIFAFEEVASDEEIETVGNFTISASTWVPKEFNESIFSYAIKAKSTGMPQYMDPIQKDKFNYIPQGNAEQGGYSECQLTSLTIHLPAIAIHFYQGKFGLLFCPAINHNHPIVINDQSNGKTFADYVKKKYGILLHGWMVEDGKYFKEVIGE